MPKLPQHADADTPATLELEFPKKGTRGFYKIGVSAKEVSFVPLRHLIRG